MHWLSDHNRSEFLACPQLVRFEYAQGNSGFEPTLLVKGSTLLLKYVVLGAPMRLAFAKYEERLLYALRVHDDGLDGGYLWSVVEREQELDGIVSFANGDPLVSFLFNELAVNVAWNDLRPSGRTALLRDVTINTQLGPFDHSANKAALFSKLEELNSADNGDWALFEVEGRKDWKPIRNHFVTSRARSSLIDIFDRDEGNQQEQISIWLTDNLQPTGAYHSPQRPHKGNEKRELTDILLSHEFGATFIESKTLSLFSRTKLPDRAKLKRDVTTDISKAFDQLRGGIRKLREGAEITDNAGNVLSIERNQPAHAIVLIPDLDLVDASEYDLKFMKSFMRETSGFPHLLDISELLRVVQAAEMIAAKGSKVTPMMAFDYYLIERAKKSAEAGTLGIKVLLRFSDG